MKAYDREWRDGHDPRSVARGGRFRRRRQWPLRCRRWRARTESLGWDRSAGGPGQVGEAPSPGARACPEPGKAAIDPARRGGAVVDAGRPSRVDPDGPAPKMLDAPETAHALAQHPVSH